MLKLLINLLRGKYDNAYLNIGLAFHRIDKFDNTIEQYRAAIKIYPNDWRYKYDWYFRDW